MFDIQILIVDRMQTIETERLILRELTQTDEAGMFALDADPEVCRYLHQTPFTSIDQSREIIQSVLQQYRDNGIGRWAVIEKASGQFVGWSGLKLITAPVNGHVNFYDVGYRLLPKFWGKGYATESAKAALSYGFDVLKARTIYGMCHVDNHGSANVLQKIGLHYVEAFDHQGMPHKWFKINT